MRMAKASADDIERVRKFFLMIEEVLEYSTYTPDDGDKEEVGDEQLCDLIREHWRLRGPGVGASWRRLVFGIQMLIDNCCDPDAKTLQWRPDLLEVVEALKPTEDTGKD